MIVWVSNLDWLSWAEFPLVYTISLHISCLQLLAGAPRFSSMNFLFPSGQAHFIYLSRAVFSERERKLLGHRFKTNAVFLLPLSVGQSKLPGQPSTEE